MPELPQDEADELDALPDGVLDLLRRGMALYRRDPAQADFLLHTARALAPAALPVYRVLYKFYNGQRQFDAAWEAASQGLAEATRQAGLPVDWRAWERGLLAGCDPGIAGYAVMTLKALAFIALRRGDAATAQPLLARLERLDPEDGTGASVVAALAAGVEA